ncbi:MAG: amidoligase family protein, partial [Candidatus Hydrogenedentes bacterium]|nr:amidoligase family protein [Candidatus Hydrogenedentota bacterium]
AVGGEVRYLGSPYSFDPWQVTDAQGRIWKVVKDASLNNVPEHLRAEIVSPILNYGDMETLQQVIRAVRAAGARVDATTAIHIHVGADPFDGRSLSRLAKLVYKQEPLILTALGIRQERLSRYTKPMSPDFIARLERYRPCTKDQLNRIWYGQRNTCPQHYDSTRYYGVNFHNVWYRGTVEFRWFEGTLHAGKVKSYVQFVLALAAKGLNGRAASSRKREFRPESAKYDFRVFLLHLGLIGDEFKTARKHLLSAMPGDAAFKQRRPKPQSGETAVAPVVEG